MPATAPSIRRDLALWMVSLRRITLLAGLVALALQETIVPGELELEVIAVAALPVPAAARRSRVNGGNALGSFRDPRCPGSR